MLHTPQCTAQPPQQRTFWASMSIVSRLKNSVLDQPWNSDTRFVVTFVLPSTRASEQPVERTNLLGVMLSALCPSLHSVLTIIREMLPQP